MRGETHARPRNQAQPAAVGPQRRPLTPGVQGRANCIYSASTSLIPASISRSDCAGKRAMRIRRAEDDDALELSVLAERTFCAAFAASNSTANMQLHCAASYGQALQLDEIRDPSRETWVAEANQRLVAYVQLRLDAVASVVIGARPVEIQRFYVDASHHGTGLAHHLMAHVLARAEVAGSAELWLGVWERNPRALAFYRKWGFNVVGDHIFMLGDDRQRDLIMRRDVNPTPSTERIGDLV
jgi:ribosomal protein S18 acetylase RimI-like enzyme